MSRIKEFDPEEALDRALDLFWRLGYEGTSMRDLLDRMEISRQSLYDTFGDKRSLFLKVLGRYEALVMDGIVGHLQLIQKVESKHPINAIRGFAETFFVEIVLDRDRGSCLMANTAIEIGPADPEVQAVVRAYFNKVEEAVYAALAKAVLAGHIDEERDIRALARHVVNAVFGLGIMSRSGASRPVLRQMLHVALSVLEK